MGARLPEATGCTEGVKGMVLILNGFTAMGIRTEMHVIYHGCRTYKCWSED